MLYGYVIIVEIEYTKLFLFNTEFEKRLLLRHIAEIDTESVSYDSKYIARKKKMNLETRIVPKDIHGIEVDSEGNVHPIINLENNTAKVSIADDIYEDIMRWICDYLKVDYFHCINPNSFEEDIIHNDFKNEGLTCLILTTKCVYTLSDMKKTHIRQTRLLM